MPFGRPNSQERRPVLGSCGLKTESPDAPENGLILTPMTCRDRDFQSADALHHTGEIGRRRQVTPREAERAGFLVFGQAHGAEDVATRVELRLAGRPVGQCGEVAPVVVCRVQFFAEPDELSKIEVR